MAKSEEEKKASRRQYYLDHPEIWQRNATERKEINNENKRRYVENNPDKRKESVKKYEEAHPEVKKLYYQKNRDHIRARVKANAAKWRNQFLEMYGGKCECCGERQEAFLTIDHILGQKGKKVKDRGIEAYRDACSEYKPDVYRVFCMNCNFATRFGDTCPHQLL
jgi:hypothetical protein